MGLEKDQHIDEAGRGQSLEDKVTRQLYRRRNAREETEYSHTYHTDQASDQTGKQAGQHREKGAKKTPARIAWGLRPLLLRRCDYIVV